MTNLELELREKLPLYKTCGYRLGSHSRAVAMVSSLLFIQDWHRKASQSFRRTWQLPFTALVHDIGYASPKYQSLLEEHCLQGSEPEYPQSWKLGVSALSIASCRIGPLPFRKAIGDATRAIALIHAKKPWNLSWISKELVEEFTEDIGFILGYTGYIIRTSSKEFGIPVQLSEAFKPIQRSPAKIVKCIKRTLGVRNLYDDLIYTLSKSVMIGDLIVTSLEDNGFNPYRVRSPQLLNYLKDLGLGDPWALLSYISRRIRKFYKAFTSRSGAAC